MVAAMVPSEREARLTSLRHAVDMPAADRIDMLRHPEAGKRLHRCESALACFQVAAEQHQGVLRMVTD